MTVSMEALCSRQAGF